ncbi:MAG: secretin N-terminal domain-containing protein [Armatimonadia bacterium]
MRSDMARVTLAVVLALLCCLLTLSLGVADEAAAEVKPLNPPAGAMLQAQAPAAQVQLQVDLAEGGATVPSTIKATPGFVTNIFADEDIRQALRDVAAQSGVVIIPDQSVQGVVSCELRGVPVEQALDMILFGGGYVYKKVNDHYLVGSADPKNPSFSSLASIERVPLRQMQAPEVFQALNPVYAAYVQSDIANNVLVVTAPDKLLRQIVEQIKSIDQPAEQVMIEVMVVEVSSGKAKDLGINWRFDSFGFNVGDPLTSNGNGSGNCSSSNLNGDGNSLSWTEASTIDIANLRLLIGKDLATIRANPRISTLNGREAELFVGRQQFFSVFTGNTIYPTTQLQEVNAGITLRIKPYVGENGELIIYLDPEVSDVIGLSSNGSPIVAKRRVHTVVRSKEAQTIVIGGLTQVLKQMSQSKVPLLGDIPVLGKLFQRKSESNVETEVVIFLRPHILKNGTASTWRPERAWPEVTTPSMEQSQIDAQAPKGAPSRPLGFAPSSVQTVGAGTGDNK